MTRLTGYGGNSHHLYFTNPGWYAPGRKLLFGSDRENRSNLFGVDLQSGDIEQLTDLEPLAAPREVSFQSCAKNPALEEVHLFYGRSLLALDLDTLEQRTLWNVPDGFVGRMPSATADGRSVCAAFPRTSPDASPWI